MSPGYSALNYAQSITRFGSSTWGTYPIRRLVRPAWVNWDRPTQAYYNRAYEWDYNPLGEIHQKYFRVTLERVMTE